jgi:DNA-binding response OmpR family regulator
MMEEILLVEPDYVWQEMLTRHLRDWGLDLCVCPTGSEAYRAMFKQRPALAVIELDLPDMTGLSLIRRLRFNQTSFDLPIVVLTYRKDRSAIEAALENSVNEYLVKSEHAPAHIVRRIAYHAGLR